MSVEKSKIQLALSILAGFQGKASRKGVSVCGLCVASKSPDRVEVLSLEYDDGINVDLDLTRHAIASLGDGDIYCTYAKKDEAGIKEAEAKIFTLENGDISENSQPLPEGEIMVDLVDLKAREETNTTPHREETNTPHQQPLPVDDYFMTIAILSQELGNDKNKVGACIVSNESLHIVSIGYKTEKYHAELHALMNAKKSQVDLTTCSLYTTNYPCVHCIMAILRCGIRVVVHGGEKDKSTKGMVNHAKACFKKYKCYIARKPFKINLSGCVVSPEEYSLEEPKRSPETSASPILNQEKPCYTDFFMAIAFLSSTRSKDRDYNVGACLVTPSPHRLVAMGYNGMPDGRGFEDDYMEWGKAKKKYICHAEVNAIIAGFRREADLSACTLYVTLSPCDDCSKLVAQSGIKNVIYAKYYKGGQHMADILERLPDMNITRYSYKLKGSQNNAVIVIDLDTLTVSLRSSEAEEPKLLHISPDGPGRKNVDLPKDDYFMALAVLATSRSPFKKSVGACLVYEEPCRAISVGYNGYVDNSEDKHYECCAEFNAIVSAYRYHADLTSATLYTTGVPCSRCATKIVQSGIKTVVFGRIRGRQNDEVGANEQKDDDVPPEADEKEDENETVQQNEAGANKEEEKKDGEMPVPQEPEADVQQNEAGANEEDEDVMEEEAKKIFYWGKVATIKYKPQTKKPIIEIDLHGLVVDQRPPESTEGAGDDQGDGRGRDREGGGEERQE